MNIYTSISGFNKRPRRLVKIRSRYTVYTYTLMMRSGVPFGVYSTFVHERVCVCVCVCVCVSRAQTTSSLS